MKGKPMKGYKSFTITGFKALEDENAGQFEAIVSVFDNVDLVGDRVVKGAFDATLKAWQELGDPIPVIWSHQWDNPDAHIGFVDPGKAEQTKDGLKVQGQLDIETNQFAAQVYRLLLDRRVKEFSFAYDVKDSRPVKDEDGTKVNELTALDLIEVGPTLRGANPETQLLGVKATLEDLEITRTLTEDDEKRLRAAVKTIEEILSTKTSDSTETEEATEDEKPEAGEAGKDETVLVFPSRTRLEAELEELWVS